MERVPAFEAWLGRPVDLIPCTVDFQKRENYRHADWLGQTVSGKRGARRLVQDVPITIRGAAHSEAKTGAYDDHWHCLAESILTNNPGDFEIVIHPSHGMNGEWFVWGVGGSREALIPDFVAARQAWSVSASASQPRKERATRTRCGRAKRTTDPYNGWALAGMLEFAKAKEVPFRSTNGACGVRMRPPFSRRWRMFIRTRGLGAHTYWKFDAAYRGELRQRDATGPATTKASRSAFGKSTEP